MSPTRHLIKLFSETIHGTNVCLFKALTVPGGTIMDPHWKTR